MQMYFFKESKMRLHQFLVLLLFSMVISYPATAAMEDEIEKANESDVANAGNTGDLGNKPERLEWLQDAGFGMFINWGVDSQIGSVISHSMVGASDDYIDRFIHDLPPTFNPHRFNAEDLLCLAKIAGMQYVVFDAKHHSGFCMWDTKTTDFNVMNTPYGRDIIKQYVEACKKYDMPAGLYYSPEDFYYLHCRGVMITRRGERPDANTDPDYVAFIEKQTTELMSNYGPISVLFIDGTGKDPCKRVTWTLQPDCLITRGAIPTPEQTVPGVPMEGAWEGVPMEGAWESCLTMGTQWQYKATNESYKSGDRIIEILIETRAKGGSLLLNVGPQPDGTLPFEQERNLREVGLWNFTNGEAIHGTRPWVVTNEENIWFTKKKDENTVYAFLTKMPDWKRGSRKEFVLQSVKATDKTTVEVLGQSSKWVEYQPGVDASCRWNQKDNGLHISVVRAQRLYNNNKWPNPVVVKITNVEPALVPPVVETQKAYSKSKGTGVFKGKVLNMGNAETVQFAIEYRPYLGFAENMESDVWQCSQHVEVTKPGEYSITLKGLDKGQYEYRAVVKHPKITRRGDKKRVNIK